MRCATQNTIKYIMHGLKSPAVKITLPCTVTVSKQGTAALLGSYAVPGDDSTVPKHYPRLLYDRIHVLGA